jgi:hypothetical protein
MFGNQQPQQATHTRETHRKGYFELGTDSHVQ